MGATDSSELLSPAAEAFAEFLDLRQEDGGVDFDAFCAARPELEAKLRRLHGQWRGMDAALAAFEDPAQSGRSGDSGSKATTDTSTSDLVERLRIGGKRAERYDDRGEIARGGMGKVVKVWDEELRRHVAMKVLLRGPGTRADSRSLSRFLDEAQITGQLEHPGIVSVHELGLDADGRVYFTMPFVRGDNLQDIIERVRAGDPKWTRTRVLGVIVRVCEAMGYAHSKGVLHRDLKPANVMVGAFGETYVMDWGLARVLGEEDRKDIRIVPEAAAVSTEMRTVRSETAESPLLTADGDVVGTPVYMSPEQAHGWIEEMGPASDVYSIGAMLYHLLTGHRPYLSPGESDSAHAVLKAVKSRAPRPVHELAPQVSAELEAICDKAMARNPKDRYASTMELAEELSAFLEMRVVHAYRTGAVAELGKWMQRNRKLAAAIAVAAFALVAGLAVSVALFLESRSNEEDAIAQRIRADANASRLAEELRARTIQQARLFGRTGDFANAEDLLWREHLGAPDDPDSYWALWELYARNPVLETVRAHDLPGGASRMRDMTIAADGSFLVTCADDNAIHVWDSATRRRVARLTGHDDQMWGVSVHPDGRLLASASMDGTVGLWDLVAKRRVGSLSAGVRPTHVAFDARGERLTACYRDGSVRSWNPSTRECTATVEVGTSWIWAVAHHPEEDLLAVAAADGKVTILRGSETEVVLPAHGSDAVTVAFSPDGRVLATGGRDARIALWDVATWERLETLEPESGAIRRLRFTPDGLRLASAGWYAIDVWDLATLELVRSFPISVGAWGVAFLPDGRTIAAALENGDLRFWSLSTDEAGLELEGHVGNVSADFTPDGRVLVTGDRRGRMRLWEVPSGRLLETRQASGSINALRIDPSGEYLVVAFGDEVRVFELASGSTLHTFEDYSSGTMVGLDVGPGGTLAMGRENGSFEVRRLSDGELIAELGERTRQPLSVSFAPDGSSILTVNRYQRVRSWSPAGELLQEVDGGVESPWSTAFDPGGNRVAISSWLRWIEIWDAALTRRERLLKGHQGVVWQVDWHPVDENLVASCSNDRSTKIWDARTGRCLLTIGAREGSDVASIRFAPDGRALLVAEAGGIVTLWDLTFFDRHIAGNLRHQLDRLESELSEDVDRTALDDWAEEVLARPWPRFAR